MDLLLLDPYPFSQAIATLVIAGQVLAVLTIGLLLFARQSIILSWIARNSILLAWIVALVAVAGSMTYSDVFHMDPCKLCWYQRIFIFPQFIILTIALWRRYNKEIADYCIALAGFAIPISLYHYLLQMIDAPAVHAFAPCDVTGQAPSCSGYYVLMYEYITIPMMALTASGLVLLFMVVRKIRGNE